MGAVALAAFLLPSYNILIYLYISIGVKCITSEIIASGNLFVK